jgi:benzoyl-CoA reductase/2-hydroxyglutaryl-CoA dehydratase subunit BcrC/BadD/HgdB
MFSRRELAQRKEYILSQRKEFGRHIMGVFPALYPRELLLALNILPVEIWDPPGEAGGAAAHLQPYICSVVRSGLELVLQGKCKDVDAFLFPHTCDSIQNLASIVNDYLGIDKPCFFFYHPKAPLRNSSRWYYLQQLKELALRLEERFGPLDLDNLKHCLRQAEETRRAMEGLYKARSAKLLDMSNREFYSLIRQGEYLHPDHYIPALKSALKERQGKGREGPRIILSGIIPNPPEILDYLDRLSIHIADDDLLCCSRRVPSRPWEGHDPFEAMTEAYFSMAPCPTRGFSIGERLEFLIGKVRTSGARGVLFQMVKFCEPELFDVPVLLEGLKSKGIPALVIDTEINQGLSGQHATRLEAFSEMIR